MVDEGVAQGLGGEVVRVEFDDGAAAGSDVVPQDAGPGRPVDARLGRHGDPVPAGAEEEVRVDPPAAGLGRGQPRDPLRRLLGERVEHRGRAEVRHAEGVGPGGDGAGDDAVVLAHHGGHAQPGQFVHGRSGPYGVGRGVPDHQLQWPAVDPAGVVDLTDGQVEPGEQMAARPDPAGARQRDESAEADGRPVRLLRSGRRWRSVHPGDHGAHWIRHRRRRATAYPLVPSCRMTNT